ncbi:MAG: hypothetical protein H8E64_06455 [Candidatus Marinimicrobia bacterium]|nr:hypothetical protein [Candidatus Neomarinimicrobiota bacterium]
MKSNTNYQLGIMNHFLRYTFYLLFISSSLLSQVTTEQIYHGARSMALAGSNVANAKDVFAGFRNPAALTELSRISSAVSFTQASGLSYLPHSMFGVSVPLGKRGTAGISAENLSVSVGSTVLTQEMAIAAHYGFYLQKDRNSSLAIGVSAKYLSVNYGKSAGVSGDGFDGVDLGESQTFGIDLGFQASLRNRHKMGVFVKNINRPKLGKASLVDLPRSIDIGLAYSPYNLVWTTFSLRRSAGYDTQYGAGLEYELIPGFTVRSGVHSNPNRLGAGFSLSVKGITVDYGLLTHPILSLTHQVSIGVEI